MGARFHAAQTPVITAARKGRWRLRNWRLRSRLVILLVIPLLLAGVLGGLRIASSVSEIQGFSQSQREVTLALSMSKVIDSLQTERHLAAALAATQAPDQQAAVQAQIQQVDANVASLRDLESDPSVLPEASSIAYRDALARLDGLAEVRGLALAPGTAVELATGRYSEVIASLLRFNRIALPGTEADQDNVAIGVSYIAEAKEQLSVQHAVLLAGSLGDLMTSVQRTELRTAEAAFDSAIRNFSEAVPSAEQQIYFSTYRGADVSSRERLLLIGLGEWPTFVALDSIAAEWDATATSVGAMLQTVEASLMEHLTEDTAEASDTAVRNAIRDASIIALLLLFTLILLVLVARSVLRPLLALRTSALDVAQRRLPALVDQLRLPGGWKDTPAPEPVAVDTSEDIGQVARAFDEVHKEAVRLATEQAMMRSTVNDMFANLSRRSQSMVERQLRIIDTLESGERDPEALGELFRLDHLATRMRRNNENLLVLAGSETRQRAGADRPALDVLRGALSEIEEYQRITIETVPEAMIRGVAVNDLVHLTAELLDNATNFSPKQAQVVLASSVQPEGGLRIEIRDLGVGMSATQRNAINERLAVPPIVDVSVSRHMGLFVVGRLAARHGISVRMEATGPEGGLTAVVSVPRALITTPAELPTIPVHVPEVAGPTSTPPAGSGSLWDAARGQEPAGAAPVAAIATAAATGTGPLFGEPVNGTATRAPAAASMAASSPGSLFAAAAASTLDPEGFGLNPSGPSLDLFAGAVPSGQQTDFFAAGSQDRSLTAQPLESTPIFQEMRSAWFRQRSDVASVDGSTDWDVSSAGSLTAEPDEDFGSAADEGWQAAEQLLVPVDAGTTRAGLPRRRPRAHLVPGGSRPAGDATAVVSRPNNVTPLRDAERVRGNLSSYQRGTRRGRHSTPVEDSERSIADPTRNGVGRHGELPSPQERP